MEKEWFTISVYSENNVGLLNRISGIFLKRHINIESLNVSKSEIDNVSKFTIVNYVTEETARKVVGQIEKQIEVIKAFYHTDDETIFQESALFKIKSDLLFDERQIQNIIKDSNSQIVTVARDFFVLAKSGRRSEIEEMHDQLKPYGIMQFVRSGRISVSKEKMNISSLLIEEFKEN
ncbi:acetolactate synthase small subunit [Maribacter sp.]|uniref:acetolactate synthase small subunit n=1 Tax=Maribacter sp. TaxID=1897614 RepID=UPI0025C4D94C|nr:acetolactate synthase small subunit [Maribacter sp.]